MNRYYLGVDIGGTKSHAMVADQNGRALGFGIGGPGNHEAVGYEGLAAILQSITRQALSAAQISPGQLAGAGFGVAGYDWPSERPPTLAAINTLGLTCPLEVVNDAIVGLLAGASKGWGLAVVAGTGENCWGWDRERRIGRVTGNGIYFGEFGGAGTVVMKAIQSVSKAWSLRGPQTSLTRIFMQETGAQTAADLLEGLALQKFRLNADHAPLVLDAARNGDLAALEIFRWAGEELGSLARGVIMQLGFETHAFEVVLIGSLFDSGDLLIGPLRTTITELAAQAKLVRLEFPPVMGGVLLGMEVAGFNGYRHRQNLIRSSQELFKKRNA